MDPRPKRGTMAAMQPAHHQRLDAARSHAVGEVVSGVMANVFWWMAVGLGLTGAVAFAVPRIEPLMNLIYGTPFVFYGLLIFELVLVFGLSAAMHRLPYAVAAGAFAFYAAVNGLTFSVIFLVYTQASIATTFFVTGGTFGAMALYGTFTKRDLTGWGTFLFMGLIGLIIAMVVNLFLRSPMLYWLITFAGVLVFTGLTAYDVQRIRALAASGEVPQDKLALYGALRLYLDFINLFLMLLRLLGSRR